MKYGAALPLTANPDLAAVRDYVQALDDAGFDFLGVGGHVLSAPPDRYPGQPPLTYVGPFYDPFVLFSYLAALTRRIEFQTSILILPLFPTALIAKQAAELAIVSGGRFALGVGISWNEQEYEALGQDVHTRGARLAEQVRVLRRLWAEPFVSFKGRWHSLDNVGLNRRPPSIPVWFGSGLDNGRALRRVARLADGWAPLGDPAAALPRVHAYMREANRDPAALMVRGGVSAGGESPAAWVTAAKALQAGGATHLNIGAPPDLGSAAALDRLIEAKGDLE